MSKRDYYEVLGVERTCSEADLKTAFRKLAMQHHPDRNPGDTECEHKFKELNEAYDVLKDGDKRAAYDRFGHAAFEQGGMGGAHGFSADFGSAFADIFEGIVSGAPQAVSASAIASVCLDAQMPEQLMQLRPLLTKTLSSITSRCFSQSSTTSSPRRILLKPGPWGWTFGSFLYFSTVALPPKMRLRGQLASTAAPISPSPG